MAQLFTNNAAAVLASSANSSVTTLTLATGQGALFPTPSGGDFFLATLTQPGTETSWEIVRVLGRSGDVLTSVDRGMEGTSAVSWSAGSKLEIRLTAGVLWSLGSRTSGVLDTNRLTLTATRIPFGNGSNVAASSTTLAWDDTNRTLTLGVGTGPSRIFTAPAASGAGASSLTIQTGAASAGVVGAGLLSVLGGVGAGASMAGNVDVAGGDHPSSGQAGNLSLRGGVSASGTHGTVTIEVGGIARITVASNGAVTVSSALTLSSTLNGTSAVFSSTLQATSGTFSSTLQATSLRVTGSTAPDNGMFLDATGVVGLSANGVEAYKYGSNAFLAQNNNTRDLGETGTGNWRNIFSQNAVTVASDRRNKTEVETSTLGLDFVRSLRPVSYRQIVGSNRVEVLDDEARTHVVTAVPGRRRHYGFLAQEVQAALAARGLDGASFAGWCIADPDNPESAQALRYEQFIAPLVKAVQELAAEVAELRARVG